MTDGALARNPGEIVYHFDVERSSITLAQFIETGRATQEIIDDFNRSLFDNRLKYEIRVKTPEEGSFIEVFYVSVAVGGSVLTFLATDIGKAFVKGLTTEEPAVWAERAGVAIRRKLTKSEPSEPSDDMDEVDRIERSTPDSLPTADISNEIEGELVALILVKFLESDIEHLKRVGITPEKFRAAFSGRNRIFKGCIANPEVKGIAFERSPRFFIKRNEFPRRITLLPDQPHHDAIESGEQSFETVDIVVNSPNWKRDGRKWQAATSKHQDIAFSIDDEGFWQRVEQRDPDLNPTIRDNMRVQWTYPTGVAKPSHVRVRRVLSYNGRQLSPPMTDQEIQALQQAMHFVEPDMPDLFDERRGSPDRNGKGDE